MRLSTVLLMVCLVLAGCGPARPQLQPKTLIIGIAGVQLECYEQLGSDTELKKSLHYGKAYTGGIPGQPSEQPTLGGPGWMTLLTGVWANKHGVVSDAASQRIDPAYPSLFKRLRDAMPNAYLSSVVSWSPINTAFLLEDAQDSNVRESGMSDERAVERTLEIVRSTPADFTFIELGEPDQAVAGQQYRQALRRADSQVGRLLGEVDKRRYENPQEDWLVIVTTDHGRSSPDIDAALVREKTIFIASNKKLNLEASLPRMAKDDPNTSYLYDYVAQTSVAVTVLRHMGVETLPEWKLDGAPLRGY
ncbi:alkaline phosphatase family protein [Pseudomonas putida]